MYSEKFAAVCGGRESSPSERFSPRGEARDFADFLDEDRLRSVMESHTGKGVRVGILDTGVDSSHPDLEGCVADNYEVIMEGRKALVTSKAEGMDRMGHGTACAGIIHRIAPDAQLYSLRVIGSTRSDTVTKLQAGLRFAIEQGWDVLNLSLGTDKPYPKLLELAEKAFYAGLIMVAAKDNNGSRIGYPASFASVIAVDMEYFPDPLRFVYRRGSQAEVEANGVYVEAPCPGGGRQSYTGTSFACPLISGLAARLREAIPDLTPFQFRTVLAALGRED